MIFQLLNSFALMFYVTRYLPLLAATFTFPQSLGILGGRPGASTYLIGVQDDKVFYLDPHEVQQVTTFILVVFLFTCLHVNKSKNNSINLIISLYWTHLWLCFDRSVKALRYDNIRS